MAPADFSTRNLLLSLCAVPAPFPPRASFRFAVPHFSQNVLFRPPYPSASSTFAVKIPLLYSRRTRKFRSRHLTQGFFLRQFYPCFSHPKILGFPPAPSRHHPRSALRRDLPSRAFPGTFPNPLRPAAPSRKSIAPPFLPAPKFLCACHAARADFSAKILPLSLHVVPARAQIALSSIAATAVLLTIPPFRDSLSPTFSMPFPRRIIPKTSPVLQSRPHASLSPRPKSRSSSTASSAPSSARRLHPPKHPSPHCAVGNPQNVHRSPIRPHAWLAALSILQPEISSPAQLGTSFSDPVLYRTPRESFLYKKRKTAVPPYSGFALILLPQSARLAFSFLGTRILGESA